MKHIKIAAGLAHVNYGRIADLVKEVSDAGVDYIHSDAADMHDLQNMKLMGGHQIIAGIRPETDKPIECHIYTHVAAVCGNLVPADSLVHVLLQAAVARLNQAGDQCRSLRMTVFSGLAVPGERGLLILFHAQALVMVACQIEHSNRIVLLSRLFCPFKGIRSILFHALSVLIQ